MESELFLLWWMFFVGIVFMIISLLAGIKTFGGTIIGMGGFALFLFPIIFLIRYGGKENE